MGGLSVRRAWTRMAGAVSVAGVLGMAAAVGGCSATPVTFDGPKGAVMFVDGKPYHLPSQVELWRPAGNGDVNKYKVALVYPSAAGDVRAEGQMEVYGYTESSVDRAVANTCTFEDEQLTSLAGGQTLIYKVKTASRQPLLDLTLRRK